MAITPPIPNKRLRKFLTQQSTPEKVKNAVDRPEFSGVIIVRLAPQIPNAPAKDLRELAEVLGLERLQRVLAQYPDIPTRRLIQSISFDELLRIEKRSAVAKNPPPLSLTSFWRLDTRRVPDGVRAELIQQLNELPEVGRARAELAAYSPTVGLPVTSLVPLSFYRFARPFGLNIVGLQAKALLGSQGEDIRCVDVEEGWVPNHIELNDTSPGTVVDTTLLAGEMNPDLDALSHGTSVLAITSAQNPVDGVVGIAPQAIPVRLASHYQVDPDTEVGSNGHVADAIAAAIAFLHSSDDPSDPLPSGDVILLEVERGSGLPTEYEYEDYLAIRNAIAHGIIVVEAAGNGNIDLDTLPEFNPTLVSGPTPPNPSDPDPAGPDPSGPDALDPALDPALEPRVSSEAIMVAASEFRLTFEENTLAPSGEHDRLYDEALMRGSNYGDRIDCFAPGQAVWTADGKTGSRGTATLSTTAYTQNFGGTSAAAAIIAGAVMMIQGAYLKANGTRLSPQDMRTQFSSVLGESSVSNLTENIKYMPDLVAIANDLGLCPVPLMLPIMGNFCNLPNDEPIGMTPDILTSVNKIERPTVVFGDRTQFGNDFLELAKVVAGQPNFIYVRVRNRGAIPAEKLIARVYAAPLSTLITPDQLTLVGQSDPIVVPIGCHPVITQPIAWTPQRTLGNGYTLIAELVPSGSEQRPLSKLTWQEFLASLCNSEGIAQRSIHVVGKDEPNQTDLTLPFLITAPPNGQPFTLEILRQLPEGVELQLEVPKAVFEAIAQNSCIEAKDIDPDSNPTQNQGRVRFRLSPLTRVSFPRILLSENGSYPSTLIVRGTPSSDGAFDRGTDSVAVRQMIGNQEVGRVTFVCKPPVPSAPPTISLPPLRRIIDLIRRRLS